MILSLRDYLLRFNEYHGVRASTSNHTVSHNTMHDAYARLQSFLCEFVDNSIDVRLLQIRVQTITCAIKRNLELYTLSMRSMPPNGLLQRRVLWVLVNLKNEVPVPHRAAADFLRDLLSKVDANPVLLVGVAIFLGEQTVTCCTSHGLVLDCFPESLRYKYAALVTIPLDTLQQCDSPCWSP